jgi:hypothetical protein
MAKLTYSRILNYFFAFLGIMIISVLIIGFFALNRFKKSDAYKVAVEYASNDQEIKLEIESVKDIGYWAAGEITPTKALIVFKIIGGKKNLMVSCDLSRVTEKDPWIVDSIEHWE